LFPSFGFLPKEGRPSLPSGSFTSGGVAAFLKKLHLWRFLRKASPLALPSESFTSGGFLRKASPLALSEGSLLVLKKARPSA
jgi:hypothetical protein